MKAFRVIRGEPCARPTPTPANIELMESMVRRLDEALDSKGCVVASHVADLMIALSDIVPTAVDGKVNINGWQRAFSHTCDRHIEAALYLLAHAFKHTDEDPSRVLVWADAVVAHLVASDD